MPVPEELNRLMLILKHFDKLRGLSPTTLRRVAASMNFGGRLPDPGSTIAFASAVGFVRSGRQQTRLTTLGGVFLELNPDQTYELTPAQKAFLARHCIFAGPYQETAQGILREFREDRQRGTYSCDLRQSGIANTLAISAVSFMRSVGVLQADGGIAWITDDYRPEMSRARARAAMSPEELEEALRRQREQGLAAEEWVLSYEKERLGKRGFLAEADVVYRVSAIDICAGYDIVSFDGKAPHFAFDRFIEVKSTSTTDPVFMWSRNEVLTAERLKMQYWIYLLTSFGLPGVAPCLHVLQNPAAKLAPQGNISLEPIQFRAVVIQ